LFRPLKKKAAPLLIRSAKSIIILKSKNGCLPMNYVCLDYFTLTLPLFLK